MMCGGVLKYAVAIVIMQMSLHVYAAAPKDRWVRKGIIQTMWTKSEADKFGDTTVSLNGVDYMKTGATRQKAIESYEYFALIQRYVDKTNRRNDFDFMVLKRYPLGPVVIGAKLLPLIIDTDLDAAIIRMFQPPGLEFVMTNKRCAFLDSDKDVVTKTYDCGNDNYYDYINIAEAIEEISGKNNGLLWHKMMQ